jgi:hypothetical protein
MKKFLCKVFGHSAETTHTNEWQVPTCEKCERCGLSRKMQRVPETNCFQWVYSDGRKSIGLTSKQISDIEFGGLQ